MYKNNSRGSSKFKGCSQLQHSCNLTGKYHAFGYYSYTSRWQTFWYDKEISFTKLKGHGLHFLSSNLIEKSDCYALERNNNYGTESRIYL